VFISSLVGCAAELRDYAQEGTKNGNFKNLDGDDTEKGITHIQIEMLLMRGRN
jgi:hypothetical protein